MSQPAGQGDALAALERLYAKKVITLEEGQAAARAIVRDDNFVFPQPPPPAPPAPAAPTEPESQSTPESPTQAQGQNGDVPSPE